MGDTEREPQPRDSADQAERLPRTGGRLDRLRPSIATACQGSGRSHQSVSCPGSSSQRRVGTCHPRRPRTLHFVGSAPLRGEVSDSLPAPHLSLGLAAQVAMDEALLAVAMTPSRFPPRADYARVGGGAGRGRGAVHARGWIAGPASLSPHTPRPLRRDVVTEPGVGAGPRLRAPRAGTAIRAPRRGAGRRPVDGVRAQPPASAAVVRHAVGPARG